MLLYYSCNPSPTAETTTNSAIQQPDSTISNNKEKNIWNVQSINIDEIKQKEITVIQVDSNSIKDVTLVLFIFEGEEIEDDIVHNEYGWGMALFNTSNPQKMISHHINYTPNPPHTLHWLDFDGDNDLDLYTYTGEEEYFLTQLHMNLKDQVGYDSITNTPIFTNNETYCALLDVNQDGIPEILDSKNQIKYWNMVEDFEFDSLTYQTLNKEYNRLVGQFDSCNFDYAMPEHYKVFNMILLSKACLLRLKDGKLIDISTQESKHFCVRKELLDRIQKNNTHLPDSFSQSLDSLKRKYAPFCKIF